MKAKFSQILAGAATLGITAGAMAQDDSTGLFSNLLSGSGLLLGLGLIISLFFAWRFLTK